MPADPAMLFSGVQVSASRFWIVERETYLGAIELRHVLTPFMLEAVGHIGCNIRPSARTIEKSGGVLDDVRSTDLSVKRRYWIDLAPSVSRRLLQPLVLCERMLACVTPYGRWLFGQSAVPADLGVKLNHVKG